MFLPKKQVLCFTAPIGVRGKVWKIFMITKKVYKFNIYSEVLLSPLRKRAFNVPNCKYIATTLIRASTGLVSEINDR